MESVGFICSWQQLSNDPSGDMLHYMFVLVGTPKDGQTAISSKQVDPASGCGAVEYLQLQLLPTLKTSFYLRGKKKEEKEISTTTRSSSTKSTIFFSNFQQTSSDFYRDEEKIELLLQHYTSNGTRFSLLGIVSGRVDFGGIGWRGRRTKAAGERRRRRRRLRQGRP